MTQTNPLLGLANKFPITKLMGLAKFGPLKPADLSLDVVREILNILDIKADTTKLSEVTKLIQQDEPESLADWIGRAGNFEKLTGLLSKVDSEEDFGPDLHECPECKFVFTA